MFLEINTQAESRQSLISVQPPKASLLPFLVPPESIDSESLILVLAFGTPSLLEAQCVLGDSAKVSLQCEDIAIADLSGGRFKGYTALAGVHKIALPLPSIDSPDFAEA